MIFGIDIITCVLGLLVVGLIYYWMYGKNRHGNSPPSLPTVPLLGSLPWVGFKLFVSNPATCLMEFRQKYGPVYSVYLGRRCLVIVNGYDAAKEVLSTRGHDFADRILPPMNGAGNPRQLGIIDGLFTPEWKEQRTFSIRNLKKFGFGKRRFESNILEEVKYLLENIKKQNGEEFEMQPYLTNTVANVICMLVFGERWDHEDKRFRYLLSKIREYGLKLLDMPPISYVPVVGPHLSSVKKAKQAVADIMHNITDFCKEQVDEHRKTLNPDNLRDYIDGYLVELDERENDPSYSIEQLVHILFDLFVAGTETSATSLQWFILYMANYPDIQAKVQDELDRVIGAGRLPSLHDQGTLPFTEAVLQELQRISNIVPIGPPHLTLADSQIMGYDIPNKTPVFVNWQSINFDPTFFPEPNEFRPERFLDDNGELVRDEHMIIFGLGPRMCLGQQLAKQELFLFFTCILHRFKVNCPPGVDKVSEKFQMAVTRKPVPFKVCLQER